MCFSCGRRSLKRRTASARGKDLHDVVLIRAFEKRLRCRRCKDKDVRTLVPTTRREATQFIEGGADMTLKKALALNITFAAMSVMAGVLAFLQIF